MSTEYVYFRDKKNYLSLLSAQLDNTTQQYIWKTPVANDTDAILIKYTSNDYTITNETINLDSLSFDEHQQEAIFYWVMAKLVEHRDPKLAIWYKKQFSKELSTSRSNKVGTPQQIPRKPYAAR